MGKGWSKKDIGTLESPRVPPFDEVFGGKSLPLSDTKKSDNVNYTKVIKHSNHTNLYDNVPPEMRMNYG